MSTKGPGSFGAWYRLTEESARVLASTPTEPPSPPPSATPTLDATAPWESVTASAHTYLQPLTKNDPRELGPYILTHRICLGGDATLKYVGKLKVDPPDAPSVFIKLLRQPYERLYFDGLQREAAFGVLVDSKLVGKVLFLGTAPEGAYLVQRFILGKPLSLLMAEGASPIHIDTLIQIARSSLGGLVAIEQAGVVHRDIKPPHFIIPDLITLECAAILVDLGIATRRGESPNFMVQGTKNYASPEQLLGMEPLDHRSDVYSWGLTLAHAGMGHHPFPALLGDDLHQRGLDLLLTRLTIQGVPKPLVWVVEEAITPNRDNRPSAAELLSMLDESSHPRRFSPLDATTVLAPPPPPARLLLQSAAPLVEACEEGMARWDRAIMTLGDSGSWLFPVALLCTVFIAVILGTIIRVAVWP